MNYVRLIAPAKVNLVLAVGNKREDGFHEVTTIMHSLAFHDTLVMRRFEADDDGLEVTSCARKAVQIHLFCESAGDIEALAVKPEDNIVYKAVARLADVLGRGQGEEIHIKLDKNIPHEAGLGGGSADAAAALVGAARLWDIDPDDERVFAVAAELGSDVTFFLHGGCALLKGKGEQLIHRLEPRKDFVLLVRPAAGVSTAAAYKEFDQNPHLPTADYLSQLESLEAAADVVPWNNLAPASNAVEPALADVQRWIDEQDGIDEAFLCGSGSAFCVICPSHDDAQRFALEAYRRGWWTRITSFSRVGAAVVEAY